MSPEVVRFAASFAVTLVAVALTATLGRRRARRAHVASATATAALLGHAIYRAELLGRTLDIPEAVLAVHLTFASLATAAFLLVLATGSRLYRAEVASRRRWHRRAVVAFVLLTLAATFTGTYMIRRSTPRPSLPPPQSAPGRAPSVSG